MAVTICGRDRLEEGLVMLKSVTLFARSPFHVHLFVSDDVKASIDKEVSGKEVN